jgi:hypothetical protein
LEVLVPDTRCRRLVAGVHRLAQWADGADDADRRVLYGVLFAVVDGSVPPRGSRGATLTVRPGLTLRLLLPHDDVFEIASITEEPP